MDEVATPESAVGWEAAAEILGWKVDTLKRRTAERQVPHVRSGRVITFVPSVLRAWMVEQANASIWPAPAPDRAPQRKRRVHLS